MTGPEGTHERGVHAHWKPRGAASEASAVAPIRSLSRGFAGNSDLPKRQTSAAEGSSSLRKVQGSNACLLDISCWASGTVSYQ